MPYVKQESRDKLDKYINDLIIRIVTTGELNYVITRLVNLFVVEDKYRELESLIGCLECCKLELYRRRVAAYEDLKIMDNGDVYPSGGTCV